MGDDAPKTALELAMARLKKQDQEAGVVDRPLTDEQRAAIAEARRVAEAKLAEREILFQSSLRGVRDPQARATLKEEYQRDRERVIAHRDRQVEEIRKGS